MSTAIETIYIVWQRDNIVASHDVKQKGILLVFLVFWELYQFFILLLSLSRRHGGS